MTTGLSLTTGSFHPTSRHGGDGPGAGEGEGPPTRGAPAGLCRRGGEQGGGLVDAWADGTAGGLVVFDDGAGVSEAFRVGVSRQRTAVTWAPWGSGR